MNEHQHKFRHLSVIRRCTVDPAPGCLISEGTILKVETLCPQIIDILGLKTLFSSTFRWFPPAR